MKDLRRHLEALGLQEVRTYIQSGNVVFQAPESGDLETAIADRIEAEHGFRPPILVLDTDRFQAAMANNPFPDATADPKSLHLFFLTEPPSSPDLDTLRAVQTDSERFELIDDTFYVHAPDGVGRSKLFAKVERALGVAATARNWRTVEKLAELTREKG